VRFDADFGAAYTDGKLTVEAALPGMITHAAKSKTYVIDKTILFAAAGYLFTFNEGKNLIGVEPKVCYRNVEDYDDIIDAGANVSFMDNLFNVFSLYHSTKNATFGLGLNLKKTFNITAVYSTGSSSLRQYAGGSFEIGAGVSLGKQEKKEK
jgi:hypothetical protein